MDVEDFPPPPPELLADSVPFADEDEGEAFDFDDSGDEVPEADRSLLAPSAPLAPLAHSIKDQSQDIVVADHPEGHLPSPDPPAPSTDTAPSSADTIVAASRSSTAGGATAEGEGTSAAEGTDDIETDLPPPPPPPFDEDTETEPRLTGREGQDASISDPHPPQAVPRTSSQGKVNPYSVIDITPLQLQQLEQQHGLSASASSPMEPKEQEGEAQDSHTSTAGITSGYSVPVPCGYATPSGVPLITPAYTTPVIIRHLSMDEDGKVQIEAVGNPDNSFLNND